MLLASRIRHGSELSDMRYRALAAALAVLFSVAPSRAQTRAITLPLDSTEGLKPVNANVESVTYKGRKALRVTDSAPEGTSDDGRFVVVTGSQFEDGLIEVDVAGDRIPGATEVARGLVGIAFRVAPDGLPFEAFYLRPYKRTFQRPVATQPFGSVHLQSRVSLESAAAGISGKIRDLC